MVDYKTQKRIMILEVSKNANKQEGTAMPKRLTQEEMQEAIRIKKYYVAKYEHRDGTVEYELCKGQGNVAGATLTEERALEWIAAGAELLEF